MEIDLGDQKVRIEPSDWRWSATIVGLSKYFGHHNIGFEIDDDGIEFSDSDISEEKYLLFAESFFSDSMHHKYVEEILSEENINSHQIEELKKKLNGNTVMKTIFKGIKADDFSTWDKKFIQELIGKNRLELIKQTFKGGRALYYNFCNENNLSSDKGSSCRIRGYSMDMGKKSKSISFMRIKNNFVCSDSKYFDFIPFAFSKTREAFFINNNMTVDLLLKTNKTIPDSGDKSIRSKIFNKVDDASEFIDYDVEVISKEREKGYFETVFIRQEAINIFKKIVTYNSDNFKIFDLLQRPCNAKRKELGEDKWIDIQKEVTNCILNKNKLDDLIEILFKSFKDQSYLNSYLIKINELIYKGGEAMKEKEKKLIEFAKYAAYNVTKSIPSNKVSSYKQKLISSISLKDYDRVQIILIQLSAYANVKMDFLVELFENFEENKNLAYTFINSLGTYSNENNLKGEEK